MFYVSSIRRQHRKRELEALTYDNRAFRRGIEEVRIPATDSCDGCDVDDTAAPLSLVLLHFRNRELGHKDHARDVDLHAFGPFGHIDFDCCAGCAADADDVDDC